MIFWGGRWKSPIDEMHWQMGYQHLRQSDQMRGFHPPQNPAGRLLLVPARWYTGAVATGCGCQVLAAGRGADSHVARSARVVVVSTPGWISAGPAEAPNMPVYACSGRQRHHGRRRARLRRPGPGRLAGHRPFERRRVRMYRVRAHCARGRVGSAGGGRPADRTHQPGLRARMVGVSPHLHFAVMPQEYNPSKKMDPLPWLAGAREPGAPQTGITPASPQRSRHRPTTAGHGRISAPRTLPGVVATGIGITEGMPVPQCGAHRHVDGADRARIRRAEMAGRNRFRRRLRRPQGSGQYPAR